MKSIQNESRTEVIAADWQTSGYYDAAERTVRQFWERSGPFRPLFDRLSLDHVVELACGHGRHVPQYLDTAEKVTLVDVTAENIDFCRQRFTNPKITFLQNDGRSFPGVEDNSVSAVFSYDAMVHFEMLDVNEYLRESARILRPGGMVLLHHSNYSAAPENAYKSSPHWRNFMSAELMRYLASRAGLDVLDQTVIDWGGRRKFFQLDCISLLQLPDTAD